MKVYVVICLEQYTGGLVEVIGAYKCPEEAGRVALLHSKNSSHDIEFIVEEVKYYE